MRGTGIFHPKFSTHPTPGLETSMTDLVRIYKPTGESAQWAPGEGITNDGFELVYEGMGRVQPNIDWRARDRNFANELTATQASRVQIMFNGNKLPGSDGAVPEIYKDYRVVLVEPGGSERNEWMTGLSMIVRNAEQASQKWVRTMLCDHGTRDHNAL